MMFGWFFLITGPEITKTNNLPMKADAGFSIEISGN